MAVAAVAQPVLDAPRLLRRGEAHSNVFRRGGVDVRRVYVLQGGRGPGEAAAQPERHVDKRYEDRHLDQRADHTGERLAGGCTEDADRDGDRELEVVGGDGEGMLAVCGYGKPTSLPIANPATHMPAK